jgi:hypothetical protein
VPVQDPELREGMDSRFPGQNLRFPSSLTKTTGISPTDRLFAFIVEIICIGCQAIVVNLCCPRCLRLPCRGCVISQLVFTPGSSPTFGIGRDGVLGLFCQPLLHVPQITFANTIFCILYSSLDSDNLKHNGYIVSHN